MVRCIHIQTVWKKKIAAIKTLGLYGIKLHPEYQNFDALDERALEAYKLIAKYDIPLAVHSGYDVAFPDSDKASPRKFAKVLELVPDLKICLAHFGGMMRWDAVWDYIAGSNCMLDTAMCSKFFPKHFFEKIISKHGIDNLMFGSDCPWENQEDNLDFVKSFGLTDAELDKVLSKNCERFLGL